MRKLIAFLLTLVSVIALASAAGAVSWNLVGSTGFSVSDPSVYTDWQRVIINSMVVDSAGNVFVTCNNGNNYKARGANPARSGGVAILKPNGSGGYLAPIKIDLSAYAYNGQPLEGGVTKLVVAGDGKVYGVQNWYEASFGGAVPVGGPYVPSRVLRFNTDGTVTVIKEYPVVTTAMAPYNKTGDDWLNPITGFTVGGDGLVYWTYAGSSEDTSDPFWKNHFFWRYDPIGGVQEAPFNGTGWQDTQTVHYASWGNKYKFFDLEYAGKDPATNTSWFAIVEEVNGLGNQYLSCMNWNGWRYTAGAYCAGAHNSRSKITATAADLTRMKIWAGGRSKRLDGEGNSPWYVETNVMSRWEGNPAKGSLFTGTVEPYSGDAQKSVVFHANGNDSRTTKISNGGGYWVNTIAIRPSNGDAWMGWGTDPLYNYKDKGAVVVRDQYDVVSYQGIPEAGANVCALAFSGEKAFALTMNNTTGAFKVYSTTDLGYVSEPLSVSAMKQSPVPSRVATDDDKVVTFVDSNAKYFYMQDPTLSNTQSAGSYSGIKVQFATNATFPAASVVAVGKNVKVSGLTAADNAEAYISQPVVTAGTKNYVVKPTAMTSMSVGGARNSIQPATLDLYNPYHMSNSDPTTSIPGGVNSTGVLVKVVGKVVWRSALISTSGASWITIDDGCGVISKIASTRGALRGLTVLTPPGVSTIPASAATIGWYVEATGVASTYLADFGGPVNNRAIRLRSLSDLRILKK